MQFLNSKISINQISPTIPFLTWKCRKTPSRPTIPNSRKIPLQSSFSLYFSRSIPSRKLQVSAHFGRHSNRQNYLREKLIQREKKPQVSENLDHAFEKVNICESSFSGDTSEILNERNSQYKEESFDDSSEDSKNFERSSADDNLSHSDGVKESETELRKKKIGESIMWNKLESWVEQYKKDSEFWGIGTGPIFSIFQDAEGKVQRVVVNDDEIMRRSRVDTRLGNETEVLDEVNFKISFAKDLAREMENGSNAIPKNSSVAKFLQSGGESRLMEAIQGVSLKSGSFPRMSRAGVLVLCVLSVVWAVRGLINAGNDSKELTRLEKEMLQRKLKSRKEDVKMFKGSVEVMQGPVEPKSMSFKRPQLDKEELYNSIAKGTGSNSLVEYSDFQDKEFKDKLEEIRAMARHARETERRDSLTDNGDEEDYQDSKELSRHNASPGNDSPIGKEVYDTDIDEARKNMSFTDPKNYIAQSTDEASNEKYETQTVSTASLRSEVRNNKLVPESSDLNEASVHSDSPGCQSGQIENSSRKNLRIIKSAREAREYLSRKRHTLEVNHKQNVRNYDLPDIPSLMTSAKVASGNTSQVIDLNDKVYDSPNLSRRDGLSYPSEDYSIGIETAKGYVDGLNDWERCRTSSGHEVSASNNDSGISVYEIPEKKETDYRSSQTCNSKNEISSFLGDMPDSTSTEVNPGGSLQAEVSAPLEDHKSEDTERNETLTGLQEPATATANEVKGSRGRRTCNSKNEISSFLGDMPDSKSTEVNIGGSLQAEVSAPLEDHKSEDTERNETLTGLQEQATAAANEVKGSRSGKICNSKNEISSFLGDVPDSKSTEVNIGGSLQAEVSAPIEDHKSEDTEEYETLIGLQKLATATANEIKDRAAELAPLANNENWVEKNFHEFEPIVKKIGVGFRDSYLLARENASKGLGSEMDLAQLKSSGAENELEWMKEERLREIVFKVRDNELSGRDPFHLMDEEDKHTFFNGLEKKVEQENEKLLKLHEYFHSNIENLDYGADGISLYDPPEKIMPRWKVPPAENNPEFLNNFVELRKALVAESLKSSVISNKTSKESVHRSQEPSSHENCPGTANVSDRRTELQKDNLASSKTIIEGSDGSVRAGKRSGKEFWQHTKKWSQGFLESYNAEKDPEVKSVMRDIGKDLDKWITEKEIQEAADLMDKIPEKGQKFIKQKLDKVKREMELFGPQAVVSKYREYTEEKVEDYLWWLDLPFVLCIELYTVENGEQRVGFYSLEMAADLELEPKQYHVIAFEDAGDCKNLCYTVQAKMEVLGNGNAFVVARPPKDTFREAKANGFSVTVIRKGELQLNVDLTLEEVEESIIEIGSKIYHDKITKERSVDINALMKGVFGVSKPARRKRSKRKQKRRTKP